MAEAAVDTTQFTGRSRKGDAARVALLDAARRIAAREGIEAIRLSAVADEANIAHATAYGYFRSRRELLQSVVAEDLNALSRAMRAVAGLPEPPDAPPPPSHIVRCELKSQGEKTSSDWSAQNGDGHATAQRDEEGDRLRVTASIAGRDNTSTSERDPALGESLDRRIAYIERKLSYLEANTRQAAEVLSRDVESLCSSFAALARVDQIEEEPRPAEAPTAAAGAAATVAPVDDGILQLELSDVVPDEPETPEEDAPKMAGESDKPMPETISDIGEMH